MNMGMRTPSIKKSFNTRTTSKMTRVVKKSVNPLYNKRGIGFTKNPTRSIKNSVYKKTTFVKLLQCNYHL